jgi:hypothetical protein
MKKYILSMMIIAAAIIWFEVPLNAKVTAADITGGVKAPHVNIAIFHKLHGHDAFKYPEHIGKVEILQKMAGEAQFILINHTSGVQDGDVITIANDVLRSGDAAFEDFGVDCQIVVHINSEDVKLSGICEMLMLDQDHRKIEHKGIIKSTKMHSGKDWQLIYYDAEDGIAVYADEEVGLE